MSKLFRIQGITTALVFSAIMFALIACSGSEGSQGVQGPQGLPGNPGAPGAQGPAGPAGYSNDNASGGGQNSLAAIIVSKSSLSMSEPFDLYGSGFISGEPVLISLRIDSTLSPVVGGGSSAQVVANAAGAFTISFDSISTKADIISRANGIVSLVAEGGQGNLASVPVVIVKNSKSFTSVSSSLIATPVESGGISAIYGSGFIPEEVISISAGDKILAGASANSDGAFSIDVTVTLANGLYSMIAIGTKGSEATAPLLISSK